jgi:hypothetical protein
MARVQAERRRHKRYQVPLGAFVGLGPYFGKVGRILDLSMGGLAFRYMGTDEPNGSSYLDIFLIDNDFYLRKLRFFTVTDRAMGTEVPTSATLRRRGVQFGRLTQRQRNALEQFIEEYAIGEA